MKSEMNRFSITYLFKILVPLLIVFCLHCLWFSYTEPVPCGDAQSRLCRPLLSYLRLGKEGDFSHQQLVAASRDAEYPAGYALLGRVALISGAAELLLREPFYLTFLLFIALAVIFYGFLYRGAKNDDGVQLEQAAQAGHGVQMSVRARWYFFLCVLLFFFFPPVQISLRSFSAHGFNLLFSLAGICLWMRGWLNDSFFLFGCGFFFLWFSAILKHFGLWLAACFLFCFIFWSLLRCKRVVAAFIAGLFFLLFCLPWYPMKELLVYVNKFNYYDNYNHIFAILVVVILFALLSFFYVRHRGGGIYGAKSYLGRKKLPLFFQGGVLSVLLFFLTVWVLITVVVVGQQGFNSYVLTLSFLGGFFFLFILSRFDLQNEYGFWFLLFYVSLSGGAVLYYSRLGYNAYVWYYPLCLSMLLTIQQTKKCRQIILLLILFGYISNFFPSLPYFQKRADVLAELRSDQNFCSFVDHPLNWHKSELGPLRESLYEILSRYNFSVDQPFYGFIKFINGPLSERLGLFYRNYYHDFPFLETEWIIPEEIANHNQGDDYNFDGLFADWAKTGYLSFMLVAEYDWSMFKGAFDRESFVIPDRESGLFRDYIARLFWDYLQAEGRLALYYEHFVIGSEPAAINLYLSRKLSVTKKNDWFEKSMKTIVRKHYDDSAQRLFLEASQHFEAAEWEECRNLLHQVLEKEPEHDEAVKDLLIVEEIINRDSL